MDGFFRDMPTLTTPRLILRPPAEGDAEDMYAYACDPQVVQWMDWSAHTGLADSLSVLRGMIRAARQDRPSPWALVDRADRRMIGTCGFNNWRPAERAGEVGYVLARPYWGRGLMTEALTAVVGCAWRRSAVHTIEALCRPGNRASAAVLVKAGFARVRSVRVEPLGRRSSRRLELWIVRREGPAG